GPGRPRHGQQLELPRLLEPRRTVLVVPRVCLSGRHSERRADDDDRVRGQVDERINLFPTSEPQSRATGEEERNVSPQTGRNLAQQADRRATPEAGETLK